MCSIVKIEKSPNEFNCFLSHVCISPGHAANFTGLGKLYRTVQNHFPALTRKEIRKWAESNLSYLLCKPLRRNLDWLLAVTAVMHEADEAYSIWST